MIPENVPVILIGCPTLLVPLSSRGQNVLLLDIDDRFEKVFPTKNYSKFNLVNCHFFQTEDEQRWKENFFGENTYILCDPPFGVMVDVLMRTFSRLGPEGKYFAFLPWFNDSRLESKGMQMLDFRVQYEKHRKMNRNNTVRIFTNADRSKITLPKENYRECKICKMYVHKSQFHCKKCDKTGFN